MNVLEAPRTKCHRDDDTTCAVHRRVNDVEVFLAQDHILIYHRLLHCLQVIPVHLTTDDVDEFLVTLKLHVLDLHLVHLVDDTLVVRSQHLCTIVPVGLVAVVLTRVVRSGNVDTCLCAKLTDGE